MGGRIAAVGDESPTYQPGADTRRRKATADPSTPLGAKNAPSFAQDDRFLMYQAFGLAPITTERDEVEISGLLITDEALRHCEEDTPRGPGFEGSHISKARCGAPGGSPQSWTGNVGTNGISPPPPERRHLPAKCYKPQPAHDPISRLTPFGPEPRGPSVPGPRFLKLFPRRFAYNFPFPAHNETRDQRSGVSPLVPQSLVPAPKSFAV
jgi:hypothetical protein